MSEVQRPVAARLQRPSWRDARLLAGIGMVLLSMVLGAAALSRAQATVPVYAAVKTLPAGQQLRPADLRRVDVKLADLGSSYLSAEQAPPTDRFVVRQIRAGELVPTASLVAGAQAGQRQVSVPVGAGTIAPLTQGTTVDLYMTPAAAPGTDKTGATTVLVQGAAVARDPDQQASLTATATVTVQVWVPAASVPAVLAAVDSGARITAVPTPGSLVRSGS